ncbi:MAG: hypothetical protein ACFBSC_11255 [Microcoleaceae cyanobacterium]
MSENQTQGNIEQQSNPVTQPTVTPSATGSSVASDAASSENLLTQTAQGISSFFNSWKFKLGVVVAVVAAIGIFIFYWPHLLATQGLKMWATQSNAEPLTCMVQDTNDDKYVSCSAKLDDQVIPLECGSSIFNIGCRVNYGSAAGRPLKIKSQSN